VKSHHDTANVSTPDLRVALEEALEQHFGHGRAVTNLERRRAPYYSSFGLEELDIRLDDGANIALMFKQHGPDGILEEARAAKPAFLYNPVRELAVYRDILAGASLGTPACYGVSVRPEIERYWLFLERISGTRLNQIGRFSRWKGAARWLAVLHTRFAPCQAPPNSLEHVITYDRAFFAQWLPRALELANRSGEQDRCRKLEWLAKRYEPVVTRLTNLPRTFIHGEFYPSNVLIDEGNGEPKVSVIDWEMAGWGPGEIDVAALTSGNWSPERRRALEREYYQTAIDLGRLLPAFDEFVTLLDYGRLHVAVQWLGWSSDWSPPAEQTHDWLSVAMSVAERTAP
jgi:hypothetical protein